MRRAALIRSLGGLPDKSDFGPPSPDLVHAIDTGTSPTLRALDMQAEALEFPLRPWGGEGLGEVEASSNTHLVVRESDEAPRPQAHLTPTLSAQRAKRELALTLVETHAYRGGRNANADERKIGLTDCSGLPHFLGNGAKRSDP